MNESTGENSRDRAGRGSPDPAPGVTEGLPNNDKISKDKQTAAPSEPDKKGDLRSSEAAGSGNPRRARDQMAEDRQAWMRRAALDRVGLSPELSHTELQSGLLRSLRGNDFATYGTEASATIYLAGLELSHVKQDELLHLAATRELNQFMASFFQFDSSERRGRCSRLRSMAGQFPSIAIPLDQLQRGLDTVVPKADELSPNTRHLAQWMLDLFTLRGAAQRRKRHEALDVMETDVPKWRRALDELSFRRLDITQLVAEFTNEARQRLNVTRKDHVVVLHKLWKKQTPPKPSVFKGWEWPAIAVISIVLRLGVCLCNGSQ